MRLLVLFLLLLSQPSFTQITPVIDHFELSGTLYGRSIYRGGVDFDDSKIPARPLENFSIDLIQWCGEDCTPVFITTIKTDKDGRFKVLLPAGYYGFSTLAERDSLQLGQYLPQSQEQWQGHNVTNSSWQLSTIGPVDLRAANAVGLSLIYHQTTFCVDCQ